MVHAVEKLSGSSESWGRETAQDPEIPMLDMSKKLKAETQSDIMYMNVCTSLIHKSQKVETTPVSTDG